MPCHATVDYASPTWEMDQETAPQCAGRSAMNANMARSPRDPDVLRVSKDDECFQHVTHFLQHHRIDVKRTVFEMTVEVNTLGDLIGHMPTPMFGGDHNATIRAQMQVLKENLSEDEIYDKFGFFEEDPDEPGLAPDNFEQIEEILEMRRWLDGEQDVPPSAGWQEIRIA